MRNLVLEQIGKVTELLGYFAGTAAIVQAARTYSVATIGDTFALGDTVVISAAAQTLSNGTFVLSAVATGVITVAGPAIGIDDGADAIIVNQEWPGTWKEIGQFTHLVGSINCSGNATLFIEQSANGVDTDYISFSSSGLAITGGTALSFSGEVVLPYGRIRIRNNGAVQTAMRAYLHGRKIT